MFSSFQSNRVTLENSCHILQISQSKLRTFLCKTPEQKKSGKTFQIKLFSCQTMVSPGPGLARLCCSGIPVFIVIQSTIHFRLANFRWKNPRWTYTPRQNYALFNRIIFNFWSGFFCCSTQRHNIYITDSNLLETLQLWCIPCFLI